MPSVADPIVALLVSSGKVTFTELYYKLSMTDIIELLEIVCWERYNTATSIQNASNEINKRR